VRQLPHRQAGNFNFKSILPVSCSTPLDGAAGQLLRMMGRHPFRSAHVHFTIKCQRPPNAARHPFPPGEAVSRERYRVRGQAVADRAPGEARRSRSSTTSALSRLTRHDP
jgi:Dioxygenase